MTRVMLQPATLADLERLSARDDEPACARIRPERRLRLGNGTGARSIGVNSSSPESTASRSVSCRSLTRHARTANHPAGHDSFSTS